MTKTIVKQSSPNLIGSISPQFDLGLIESFVWNKGYSVVIEKAFQCPCSTYDNAPQSNCQNCLGTGWIFINPIETKALITSINKDTKYKSWSEELSGTVSVTVREQDKFSFMDRITLKNSSSVNNTSVFSDKLMVRDLENQVSFVFTAYKSTNIIGIWAFDGENNPLVRLPESTYSINSNNPYVIDITFDFATITNFNGYLTAYYEHEIQYHIQDIPHNVRNSYVTDENGKEQQILLPVNAYAKLAHNIYEIANRDGTGVIDNSVSTGDTLFWSSILNNNQVLKNNTIILRQ